MKEKLGMLQEMNYIQIWGICNTNYGGTLYKAYRESKKFGIEINWCKSILGQAVQLYIFEADGQELKLWFCTEGYNLFDVSVLSTVKK